MSRLFPLGARNLDIDFEGNAVCQRLASRFDARPVARLVQRIGSPTEAEALGLAAVRRSIVDFHDCLDKVNRAERTALLQKGQIHWSDTTLAKHQRAEASHFLARTVPRLEPLNRPLALIDFGAGDGRMTAAALSGLERGGAEITQVRMIDQNTPALNAARTRLSSLSDQPAVKVMPGDFRTLSPLSTGDGANLALASAAFHELNRSERTDMFNRLSTWIDGLFIVELSQDNDSMALNSEADVLITLRFYDRLIGDAYASLDRTQFWPVIGVFLLGELLQILGSDYEHRGNYHLPKAKWSACLGAAGFEILADHQSMIGGLKTTYLLAAPAG